MGNGLQKYGITRELVSTAHHEPDASTLALISDHPELLTIKHSRLGGTVWHYAAKRGNVDLLHSLIRFAATRMQDASLQQQQRFITLLLNQSYGLGDTPLMLACAGGHVNAVSTLLQHGADPQKTDRRGKNNCLHLAAAYGHVKVIQVILQTEADFPLLSHTPGYSVRSDPQSVAGRAARARVQHPASAWAQQASLQAQAPGAALLDTGEMYGLTPLHIAICKQRHEAVAALLQAGASLSAANTMPVKEAVTPNMPRGTTPLHAAVRIGDQQIVVQILACHLQRLGGTAAGSTADPRLLRDERRQLPWHVAKHFGRPNAVCELLNPTASLREQLQLAVLSAGPALNRSSTTAAQRESSAAAGTFRNSVSASFVHVRSLQEIAAVQLKRLLLEQAACIAATAGTHLVAHCPNDPPKGSTITSCGQSSSRHKHGHGHGHAYGHLALDEQLPVADAATECSKHTLQDTVWDLLQLLQSSPVYFAGSVSHVIQGLCTQLQQHISSSASAIAELARSDVAGNVAGQHAVAEACMPTGDQQPAHQAAAAAAHLSSSSSGAADQLTQDVQLLAQQLLDVIRSQLLTSGTYQLKHQDSCSSIKAYEQCESSTAAKSAAAPTAAADESLHVTGMAVDRALMSSSQPTEMAADAAVDPICHVPAAVDPICHVPAAAAAPQQTQGPQDAAANLLDSSKLRQLLRQLQVFCVHSQQGQGFSAPSSAGSSGSAGLSLASGSSGLSGPSGSSGSHPHECGVCLEAKPLRMLSVQPCRHMLCVNCCQVLVGLITRKPAQCPFCRTAIAGCIACEV